ncbi:type II secretion system F family protein [Ramlibacter sp. AN1015]|uniref:type II secretion system F family protein n=1 Tax=Ramlibacter sp. AN1015 TaxID=3133428 RepID=UPI0030BA691F
MLVLSLLVFLSCVLALAAILVWASPSRVEQRLQDTVPIKQQSGWSETAAKAAARFARLTVPSGEWETSPIRIRMLNAGIRHPDAPAFYFAAKSLLPLLLAGVTYTLLRSANYSEAYKLLLFVFSAALIGCYLPNLVLYVLVRSRQRDVFEGFPDAADLMLVCVEAGLGLDASMNRVADEIERKSPAVAEELLITNLEMRAGVSREQALRNLALRTGVEEISIFASMLTQADRFGTDIGDSMRVFSDDLRHKRQTRAEELAAKIPVKMLFPLVLCIFPAILMVLLGPVMIQAVRTMFPLLGGKG